MILPEPNRAQAPKDKYRIFFSKPWVILDTWSVPYVDVETDLPDESTTPAKLAYAAMCNFPGVEIEMVKKL